MRDCWGRQIALLRDIWPFCRHCRRADAVRISLRSIVMARTNPPIPDAHILMLYRVLFFLPLFRVEFSTVSLPTLLPSMRVTAAASSTP